MYYVVERKVSTSQSISHEDFIAQRVAEDDTDKLLIPGALDKLTSFTRTVGGVIPECEWDPDGLPT